MILKPQDLVILLKLVALGGRPWSYASVAQELSMSASEVHGGVKRAVAARLLESGRAHPLKEALEEFVTHGVRYAFPPERGGLTRGMPTGYAAPPLKDLIVQPAEPPPVWPYPDGKVRGYGFSPLYRSVPQAAARDPVLYEFLALVDAIRDGRAREKELAIQEFKTRLAAS